MNRILLILLLFSAGISACKKTNDVAAQVRTQAAADNKIIDSYLSTKGLTALRVDTTDVRYIVDTAGTGNTLFTSSTQITVGYTGRLLTTGAIFAQTNNFHPTYVLGQVIRAWQLGIPKIKNGGTVKLFVPSRYAYGPYPQSDVGLPANAVLIFDIKLFNVTN
ncbi:MAG: FKBP-type peptidyl-prolyl cis-trans isomerase [Bacteroidota bacterium]|nr:FKBP-type peptidyl-prolyl cis-trans isomerase [Bacteroidota bacterium]